MSNLFVQAERTQARLRLAIEGPSGSGKSYTALRLAMRLAKLRKEQGIGNGKVAVVDTESGSLSKYFGDSNPDGGTFDFDVIPQEFWRRDGYTVPRLIEVIKNAASNRYSVALIDSISHFWFAEGGLLDVVDKAAARSSSKNTYFAWKEATPLHNQLITTILGSDIDVIACMRTKTEYVIESGPGGKQTPRKIGMAPIQREGLEYEFDIVIDVDLEHNAIIGKTRCSALIGKVYKFAGAELADTINEWLTTGTKIEFELEPSRAAKLKAIGATDDQINALRSIEEATALFNSLRSQQKEAA